VSGEVVVPGSKSHTIRALAIAAAADGDSEIEAPLVSEDALSALGAAESLGASAERGDGVWRISGVGGRFKPSVPVVDMGNSGTSLRLFVALASTVGEAVSFDGDASLRTRPLGPLISALERLGASFSSAGGKCPLTVRGPVVGGETSVDAVSSQFLSALLIALPLSEGDSLIHVERLNERPYVEMTLDWLRFSGAEVECSDDMSFFNVRGGFAYPAFSRRVPGDFSSAAFPLAMVSILGGELFLGNLDFDDYQGDKAVFEYFERMGVCVERRSDGAFIRSGGRLRGGEFDLNATPDALPIMAVAGAFADGETALVNCPQARIKETDRIALMAKELRAMGADVDELPDGMVVKGGGLRGAVVDSHGDHRIAMALTVGALAADGDTTVIGSDAASVTYPRFYDDIQRLGADVRLVAD
jgi:3-phosphoshikimate 1-carboxyvinyltransferase